MGFAVAVFQLLRTQVRLKLYSLWHNEPLYRRTWYHTPNHHGLGLPDVRRACRSARRCRARDLLWRRPVGERLARGYQNVLMSPILVKERGRPSDCSAGCPALVGWLD